MSKDEYRAKAEGYKGLTICGLVMMFFGIFAPFVGGFTVFFLPLGFLIFIIGTVGYSYYSFKYEALVKSDLEKHSSMKICPYCGALIPFDAVFCVKCGRALE